jgi:GT2 family glycosyltransferase
MIASLPFISVIVPARDRPAALSALLYALADQSYPPGQFEVLICDDGSDPPLAELVPARQGALTVRYLRGEQGGPAVARNRGVSEARGSILAFTDDDCLPEPGWLEAIAEAFATLACEAVHGPTCSSVPPLEGIVHSVHAVRPEDGVATANFAVSRAALQAVGGFDETFTRPYFEDEDLARRIEAMIGPIAWSEDVRVEHPPRPSGFAAAWRGAGHWRWLPYMERLHPGVREGAMRGVRLRVAAKSALVLLGVSPVAGAPVSFGLGLLGLAAWQARRLRRVLAIAVAHGWRVPLGTQLAYVAGEWLLDYRRWAAYVQGRDIERVERDEVEEELGF